MTHQVLSTAVGNLKSKPVGTIIDLTEQFSRALKISELPDIVTFAEDPLYCGKRLYPRQKTLLRVIFCELEYLTDYDHRVIDEWIDSEKNGGDNGICIDVYDRMEWLRSNNYKHFREIIDIGGRRGGKGHLGGIIGAYKCQQVIGYDDPQWYYGIDPNKDLYLNIIATSSYQARKYLFADVSNTILSCKSLQPYIITIQEGEIRLQTPADLRKIAYYKANGIKLSRDIASVRAQANSTMSTSGRGGAAICQMLDEFAHMLQTGSSKSGEEVYEAYTPSLDECGKDGLIYIPSSPYTKVGKFYDLCMAALKLDEKRVAEQPNMLVVQHTSWEMYRDWDMEPGKFRGPIQAYDEGMKMLERRKPQKFKVERRAQFAETIDAYLASEAVDKMFADWKGEPLEQQSQGKLCFQYKAHNDPSKTNCNFATAIAHTEPDDEGSSHVVFDWLHVYRPEDFPLDEETGQPTINYIQVEEDLVDLVRSFPTMFEMSFDQWNSIGSIQRMRDKLRNRRFKTRIKEITATNKLNEERFECFKTVLNLGWVHAPCHNEDHELGKQELKFLQEHLGKVVKQSFGPVQTKDLADCMVEVTYTLLKEQVKRWNEEQLGGARIQGFSSGGYNRDDNYSRLMGQSSPGKQNKKTAFDSYYQSRARTRGRQG